MMEKQQTSLELCDILNQRDEVAFKAVTKYLDKHKLPYLKDRMLYELSTDFGAIKPLRETWIKVFDLNPIGITEFYEEVYRFRKIPRYENLLLTVLLSLVTSVIANVIYCDFKEWQQHKEVSILSRFKDSTISLLDYLLRAFACLEAYYLGKINISSFNKTKLWLKSKFLKGETVTNEAFTEAEFNIIWIEFSEKHDIDSAS
jgi:hypothetical protein